MFTETLTESRLREAAPSGFQTTFTDEKRLRQLKKQDVEGVIDDTVQEYDGNALTEREIIEYEIQRVLASFLTPERTMELPGLGLEHGGDKSHLFSFAAMYKQSDDTPTGSIKDARRATSDDLIFTFATPEVYNTIVGAESGDSNYVDNFIIEDVEAGDEITLVGEDGYNSSTDSPLDLDDDERLFYTGDFIDVSPGKSIFNRHEWVEVDGESTNYGPASFLLNNRLSGANLALGHGAHLKRDGHLKLKAYEDGDAEVWPVAFYMAPGHKAPGL